jgi:hypothetical protein
MSIIPVKYGGGLMRESEFSSDHTPYTESPVKVNRKFMIGDVVRCDVNISIVRGGPSMGEVFSVTVSDGTHIGFVLSRYRDPGVGTGQISNWGAGAFTLVHSEFRVFEGCALYIINNKPNETPLVMDQSVILLKIFKNDIQNNGIPTCLIADSKKDEWIVGMECLSSVTSVHIK